MKKLVPQSDKERAPESGKRENRVSWFTALKHSLQGALHIDRSKITAGRAIRGTIPYALALAIGVGTGHVLEGVLLAGGAALLGAVGLTFTHRARARTLLLACAGIALSAFIGTITGNIVWLAILLIGIWGFGAGLLVAISQSAMVIGLQSTLALIIFSHYATDPTHAALWAALLFSGALLQTLFALIPIPLEKTSAERSALTSVYQKLADYAAHPTDEEIAGQLRDALQQAHATLLDANLRTRVGRVFFGLLEEAGHIRLTIILLTKLRQILEGNASLERCLENLDRVLQAASYELREIARELKSVRRSLHLPGAHQELKQALIELRKEASARDSDVNLQRILTYCEALHAQLHTAHNLARAWRSRQQPLPAQVHVPEQKRLRLYNIQAILRANLTFHSTAFRHAIRLGVALMIASVLEHLLPLPLERGYWIPLTVLLILRPDFSSTFTRGMARFLGTLLGVVLTSLLIALIAPSQLLLVILAIITAYMSFSLLYANYALFSVFITMEVIFLLSFVIPQPIALAYARAIATAIGGVLALVLYVLWPSWESSQLSDNLANRLDALRSYLDAVLTALADPAAYDDSTINNRRLNSLLARSNAEASLQHTLQEPQRHHIDIELAQGVLDAANSIAQSALTLEAYVIDNPKRHPLPVIRPFANAVDEALRIFTMAMRQDRPPEGLPNLQEALHKLEHDLKAEKHVQPEADIDQHLIISQAKRIVRSIDAINQLLVSKWSETGGETLSQVSS
ncbi:MAG TPA: FUSC family protein [Ktedonobacteraceae bacterium]